MKCFFVLVGTASLCPHGSGVRWCLSHDSMVGMPPMDAFRPRGGKYVFFVLQHSFLKGGYFHIALCAVMNGYMAAMYSVRDASLPSLP